MAKKTAKDHGRQAENKPKRPRPADQYYTQLRIPKSLAERVQAMAKHYDVSINAVITQAAVVAVERFESGKKRPAARFASLAGPT